MATLILYQEYQQTRREEIKRFNCLIVEIVICVKVISVVA